jgi:DNA topoisomerase-1
VLITGGNTLPVSTEPEDVPPPLVWRSDSEPGITRRRAGTGFSYRGPNGSLVDESTRARIKRLAIPPAWTDVWICTSSNGHLQATGRDARGRKQYRYHPDFRAHRDAVKFDRLVEFGESLAPIRKQVEADLALPALPKTKVTALVVRLLEDTMIRVGNEEYARANASYGLTTLRDRHAKFTSSGLRLVFTSKHGVRTDVVVPDRRLRSIVRRCQDLPGQVLFQYLDEESNEPRPISSTDVNDYLRSISGENVTAKDFRTWKATLMATVELAALPSPTSDRDARSAIVEVASMVSDQLRNTPAVSRGSYIHPAVFDAYRAGDLAALWQSASPRGPRRLSADERRLLRVLTILEHRRVA